MLDLLNKYSVEEIIVFIVLLALAIKEVVNFIDWAKARVKTAVTEDDSQQKVIDDIMTQLDDFSKKLDSVTSGYNDYIEAHETRMTKLEEGIGILMDSDKDDIKAWITEQHHYFVYEKGYIDDYYLDCIERRFKHYQDEGGNSFAEDLMKDIRNLPKVSLTNGKQPSINNNNHH